MNAVLLESSEQESDNEGIEPVPQVPPREVLRLLQTIKLGEMQSDDCNADYISCIERYEQVVQKRHILSEEEETRVDDVAEIRSSSLASWESPRQFDKSSLAGFLARVSMRLIDK